MDYTYTFSFSKTDSMIYISHLDLMRLFNRAARRVHLPLSLTQGFSPHFKIKLNKALKLGVASGSEEGEFVLMKKLDGHAVKEIWQAAMPDGIMVKDVMVKELSP